MLSDIPLSGLLLYPPGLCLILLTAAVVVALFSFKRLAVCLTLFAVTWVGVWSLPITSIHFGKILEEKYAYLPSRDLPRADVIIVLGGNTQANRANWFEPYNRATAVDRIDRAEALYLAGRAPRILLSGGAREGKVSEAQGMARLLKQRGIPDSALILENESRNTYENLRYSEILLRSHKLNSALLVTSALHMPRAQAAAEKRGIKAIPASSAPQIVLPEDEPPALWWPHIRSLEASRTIIKEYLGILGYKLRGWI